MEKEKRFVRNVVLPNVAGILLSVGYVVFMFTVLIPQMDVMNNDGDAFVVLLGLLVSIHGVGVSIDHIVTAYIDMEYRKRKHRLYIKHEFSLFNEHYWSPDYNMRDLQNLLKEAKRLGVDKELPTDRDCRIYLYGHDPEENRPPRPKFNSQHTMIEVEGKWYNIPDKFYGSVMDEATVKQIKMELKIT